MAISPPVVGFDYTKEDDGTPVMSFYFVEVLYRVCFGACAARAYSSVAYV